VRACAALIVVLSILALAGCSQGDRSAAGPRVIVLGLDGMDHGLTTEMLRRGELPNLARLAREGGFAPLETTTPPQSPTAWSSFITGQQPGHHGIFDFVQRDPATLMPYLSTSRVKEGRGLTLGSLRVPISGGEAELLRRGTPFWWYLGQRGVPATVIRIPAHFPPRGDGELARVLTDMGTPDLLGTYGTFTVLTDDAAMVGRRVSGGRVVRLRRAGEGRLVARLEGPADPMSAEGEPLSVEVTVEVDRTAGGALLSLGGQRLILGRGEWSRFVPVEFSVAAGLSTLHAVVRVYLKSVAPGVTLYVSPLNIDPLDPALPISSPPEFAAELARAAGRFYTQGMPEDTKALSAGVLSEEEFLQQAELVLKQRRRMLIHALSRFSSGLLFFYFGSSDQVAHMFFRGPRGAALERIYRELDREVGRAMRHLRDGDLLLVMSDHGFGRAGTLFDLNGWLARKGYLTLRDEPDPAYPLGHIDWRRTRAYGLGLNGLYLNLEGREAEGVVPPSRRDALLARLARELLAVTDESGRHAVTDVARPDRRYPGPEVPRAPDLIVGYGRGFKVADPSAMGLVGKALFSPNESAWSADHCGDHRLVPGILFSSRRLRQGRYSLVDLAPTILDHLGVPTPAGMVGRPVLAGKR
jgi:predicted AlkP superfamily phosphohydrolase/phosphomutase